MPQVSTRRTRFASQMNTDLYECLKTIARQEGRPIGAVLEDAARAFIENRKENIAKKSVLDALDKSMIEHDTLYKKLAK
ncbi:hypothetical protein SDC9_12475 [bioreactor metagenome]|uniref:Ribbon-helix-helix protein CopG domain-containing protein n=1 Tax=bioreactor metagenome TaxID=1076179 RepID=A0A644TK41_9ZZZZ|nr:hypothetical protein [Desulfovibrio desulfuricans]MEA4991093.1 hypothetical protein [Desulfovibrio desulfuricans]